MKKYIIKYNVYTTNGNFFDKEIKVKKENELYAKVGLEGYLKKKYKDAFQKFEIISCKEDTLDYFNNLFRSGPNDPKNNFGEIFNDIFTGNYGNS